MSGLYVISSGSCVTLNATIPVALSRLFIPGDIYLYNYNGFLASRDGGGTFAKIGNLVNLVYSDGICQTTSGSTNGGTITVAGGKTPSYLGKQTVIRYHVYPESTTSTWSSGSAITSGVAIADMVADYGNAIGILIGNSLGGSAPRMLRSTTGEPFTFVKSDAGIPQSSGSIAIITDIEICE